MTEEQIKFLLSEENNEPLEAHKEIVSIQKDKNSLILLDDDWLNNNLVGGLNNKIIFGGSRPGNGKTTHCSKTINALLNSKLNPVPINIIRFNLEMPTQTLLLQQLSRSLSKSPKEILEKPYSEEERPIVTDVVNSFMDKRIKNISRVLKAQDFKNLMLEWLKDIDNKDREYNNSKLNEEIEKNPQDKEGVIKNFKHQKTKKVALIDHLHIYRSKEEIDSLLLVCNELKMLDKNLSFIIYFQLRRDVEDLWRDTKDKKVNPKNMLPNSTFIYMSDVLQQVADLVFSMVIPQIYELDDYVAVHKERNIHLKEHFSDDLADNSFTRLKGRNRIYYNLLKIRLLNSFDDPRIFCDVLNKEYEEKANKMMEENKSPFKTDIPLFSAPIFDATPIKPASLNEAFGSSFENSSENDPPF